MKIVFFTGSGISQESGVPTFRDRMALWDNFDPERLASKSAWRTNKEEMLMFHNQFRNLIQKTEPNKAHRFISDLQNDHEVTVVTQNVDDLHERSGSNIVYHLHGNIFESRSSLNPNIVYPCNQDISIGDKCEKGSQLRPNVVWFGEELNVTMVKKVEKILGLCDLFVVIGTSLSVYPASDMVKLIDSDSRIVVVDPNPNRSNLPKHRITFIEETAVNSVENLRELI
jgi:NAD-dependent deacetylase